MKVNLKFVALACLLTGLCSYNVAMSDMATYKIAVVNIPEVVAKSEQVKALKNEQVKKAQNLEKWLETVNADVKKQSTDANKQKLLKKYNDELMKKKEANSKEYAQKLTAIDANISKTIEEKAKAKGYGIVLSKSSVLYGGDDITAEIAKAVK